MGDIGVQGLVAARDTREMEGGVAQDSLCHRSRAGGKGTGRCAWGAGRRGEAGGSGWSISAASGRGFSRGEDLRVLFSSPNLHVLLLSWRSQIKGVYFSCCPFSTYKIGALLPLVALKHLRALHEVTCPSLPMQEGGTCMLAQLSVTLN